jgi:prolyl oligopeptidase
MFILVIVVVVVVNQTLQHELCTSVVDRPQTNPIIARIDRKAGHGCGRPTQKMVNTMLHLAIFFCNRCT